VNPVPVSVTPVPTCPLEGAKLVIAGAGGVTVKLLAELAVPDAVVTEIFPVAAPAGTVVVTCVAFVTVNVAAVLPNVTAVAPARLLPVKITLVPTAPFPGAKLAMDGNFNGAGVGAGLVAPPPPHPLNAQLSTNTCVNTCEIRLRITAILALNPWPKRQ